MGHIASFVKYVIVGGSAALINWAVFYLGLQAGLQYLLSGVLSFVIATLWNFIFARIFIFTSRRHSLLKEGALVYLVSLGGLVIDMGVLYACVEWLGISAMVGKVIATGVAFVFNFLARYLGVYR